LILQSSPHTWWMYSTLLSRPQSRTLTIISCAQVICACCLTPLNRTMVPTSSDLKLRLSSSAVFSNLAGGCAHSFTNSASLSRSQSVRMTGSSAWYQSSTGVKIEAQHEEFCLCVWRHNATQEHLELQAPEEFPRILLLSSPERLTPS
jgi:hypothetical protein